MDATARLRSIATRLADHLTDRCPSEAGAHVATVQAVHAQAVAGFRAIASGSSDLDGHARRYCTHGEVALISVGDSQEMRQAAWNWYQAYQALHDAEADDITASSYLDEADACLRYASR